ncbi:iron ABC transporter permease [SAR202 cluster bacterium AD-804-J14_MRT_500m]|nr:iron ABC transporter permease [SAR202 cluster bacterium AD-804-J14_MRT_500m]
MRLTVGGSRTSVVVWLPALFIAVAIALPIVYLAVRALGAGSDFPALIFRARTLEIVLRSLALVAAVTTGSLVIALPLAWLTTRTDLPLRRTISVMTSLPLVIPSYIGGFIVLVALGPKGMLQGLLEPLFGIERLPEIYGFPGAVLTLTLLSYPYVLLPLRAALMKLDPSLEDSSRSLGHSGWTTFRRVTVPLLKPAISAGALLVALYTLSDFGAVSLLGYETFTWAIYIQFETAFDRNMAAALSLILMLIAISILLIDIQNHSRNQYYRSSSGSPRNPSVIRLGNWKWPSLAFCSFLAILALLLPMSILTYWAVRGISIGESIPGIWTATVSSLYVSVLAAGATLLTAIPVAVFAVQFPGWRSSLLERTTYIGFALPGIVIALALVFFGARYGGPVYQTLPLLIFAYIVLFLPAAVGSIRTSLLQISPRIEEAARNLGKGPMQVLYSITIPIMRPGLLAGGALVFMLTMKELPATMILSPIGFDTLAISIWSTASEAFFAEAAVHALLLVLVSSIPMTIFMLKEQR